MTDPVSTPMDLYTPTGKSGRLADRAELGRLAAAVVAATLASIDTSAAPVEDLIGLSPDTTDLRPGSLAKHQLTIVSELAKPLGCTVHREAADNLTVYGDTLTVQVVARLGARVLTDLHDFADRDYLRVFYHLKGKGRVEEARGERTRILDEVLTHLRRALTDAHSAAVSGNPALTGWLTANSASARGQLPQATTPRTRTERAPAGGDKERDRERRLDALKSKMVQSTPAVASKSKGRSDEELETIYGRALTLSHNLKPGGPPVGAAFYTGTKTFSSSAAVMAAEERLGATPTHYRFWQGYLYLSAPATGSTSIFQGFSLANAQYAGVGVQDAG